MYFFKALSISASAYSALIIKNIDVSSCCAVHVCFTHSGFTRVFPASSEEVEVVKVL